MLSISATALRRPSLCCFGFRTIMAASSSISSRSNRPQWDAEAGVWKGDRALASTDAVPKPLYVFGYGSLMFKPQESFARCERFDGLVYGYRRIWAQRSTDHRGTPEKPGLVCTVLSDEGLVSLGIKKVEEPPSNVHGVVYLIPEEQTQEALDELDFREKGGYTRVVVDVHLTNLAREETRIIKALLYAANTENPNHHRPFSIEEAAQIIAWGRGPSGENKEYLFEVASYLRRAGASCPETFELIEHVENILSDGVDRRAFLDKRYTTRPVWHRLELIGWGSNQHGQLGWHHNATEACGGERGDWCAPQLTHVEIDLATPASEESSSSSAASLWNRGRIKQLVAGGGHSALLLDDGKLFLWGWNEAGQTAAVLPRLDGVSQLRAFPRHVDMVALGHAHTLILEKETGNAYGLGANAVGEASGHVGPTTNRCEEGGGLVLLEGWAGAPRPLIWIAAGVKHSAGVTRGGELVTWGSRKYGEGLPSSVPHWRPTDGANVVKVWGGWHHTLILDDRGRVWTMGANKYGQLGRSNGSVFSSTSTSINGSTINSSSRSINSTGQLPGLVEWPSNDPEPAKGPQQVVDVACGWSHTVVRTTTGDIWGWGRNTFGQLTGKQGYDAPSFLVTPTLLLPEGGVLPNGGRVKEVRCGTESIVLIGEDGGIWTRGWNEHGNLGVGDTDDRWEWTAVSLSNGDGEGEGDRVVACGGAHVLVL